MASSKKRIVIPSKLKQYIFLYVKKRLNFVLIVTEENLEAQNEYRYIKTGLIL